MTKSLAVLLSKREVLDMETMNTAERRPIVGEVVVLRGCGCGPHRCRHCDGQLAVSRCTALPFDLVRCPHCGYPTKSRPIETTSKEDRHG